MSEMMSLTDLLDFVIKREETSAKFFSSVADRTSDSILREIFRSLMKKCVNSKSLLSHIRGLEGDSASREDIPIDSIREYLVDVKPRPEISDLQALALGGLRSETSEKLYARISLIISEPEIEEIFEQLHGDHRLHRQLCNCLYDQHLEQEP
jgi:rubrerythrin